MIISDLEHMEIVSEETRVEGGFADASAYSSANANGSYFASTYTSTYTSARSGYSYPYYSLPNSAYSSSGSSSTAA